MTEEDFWSSLNKEYVISMLIEKGLDDKDAELAIMVFIDILTKVEESESMHIKNHIVSTNDIRSAALCFEAMGAFNLLKNTIGENIDTR
jgi:hypothetical protein